MSECASRHDRGRMVALVFSMQGLGLLATVMLLPEPKGVSLEELTEVPFARSGICLHPVAERRRPAA